jgi:hypothetical protein
MIYIGNNEFRTAKSKIYLGNAGLKVAVEFVRIPVIVWA